jgi:hypothetical protein
LALRVLCSLVALSFGWLLSSAKPSDRVSKPENPPGNLGGGGPQDAQPATDVRRYVPPASTGVQQEALGGRSARQARGENQPEEREAKLPEEGALSTVEHGVSSAVSQMPGTGILAMVKVARGASD